MTTFSRISRWGFFVLGPLSLLLGFIGYRSLGSGLSPGDALFGSFQLFALDASRDEPGAPWPLEVARFTAPLALVLATTLAVVAVMGEKIRRWTLSWRGRDHIVVLGLSDSSAELVRALREASWTVVVVEADSNHPALPSARTQGAVSIAGDARQAVILRRARADRARHIIVTTGDDSRNLEICERLVEFAETGHHSTVHVAIHEESLWQELERVEIETMDARLVFDFYNSVDREAATFLQLLEVEISAPVQAEVFRFEGSGAIAERVLLRLARRAAADQLRLRIHASAETDETVIRPLRVREPWFASRAEIVSTSADEGGPDSSVIVLCLDASDAVRLSTALRLTKEHPLAHVYVHTTRQHGKAVLDMKGLSNRISMIPAGSDALEPAMFLGQSAVEIMARARHEDYCANEMLRGNHLVNPSVISWSALPESLKESNRNFARAVSTIIGQRGGRLAPIRSTAEEGSFLADGDIETLARGEHDRWMADLVHDGWVSGSAPKDPVRKTHPLLVDWNALSEEEREKDRDGIRAIPRMLARVGYSVVVD